MPPVAAIVISEESACMVTASVMAVILISMSIQVQFDLGGMHNCKDDTTRRVTCK